MFQFTREELLELLSKTFDEGHNGYQDLKDCFISKIIEDLEERKQKAQTETKLWDDAYVRSDVFGRTSRPWMDSINIPQPTHDENSVLSREFQEMLERNIGQLVEQTYITNSGTTATIAPQYVVSSNSASYFRANN